MAQDFLEKETILITKKTETGAMLHQDKTQQLKEVLQTVNLLESGKLFTIKKPTKEV